MEATTREMEYENAQGLRVTRVFTFYPGFQAVEHKTYFENFGSQDLPALSHVSPVDLWFPFSAFERLVVHATGTGTTDAVYPVPFWTLNKYYLLKDSGSGLPWSEWSMGTGTEIADRGAQRPMALLEDEDSGEGMFVEMGWGGYWQITFRWTDFTKPLYCLPPTWATEHPDTLQIEGGMPGVDVRLRPGERIPSPHCPPGLLSGRRAPGQ